MLRFLVSVFVICIAACVAIVAIGSDQAVTLTLDPSGLRLLSVEQVEMSLMVVIVGVFALGLMLGVLLDWANEHAMRRRMRAAERRAAALERKMTETAGRPDPVAALLARD